MKRSMKYTAKCMELTSFVVGFDIVELWTRHPNGHYHCMYVHATEDTLRTYTDVIIGAGRSTNNNKTHLVSPKLCDLSLRSSKRCYWRIQTVSSDGRIGRLEADLLDMRVRTEMAYYFETDGITVFIVGFSVNVIPFKRKALQFIYGIAYSIYVAACGLDEEEEETSEISAESGLSNPKAQLDTKAFNPRPFSHSHQSNLSDYGATGRPSEEAPRRVSSADSGIGGASVWRTNSSVAQSLDKLGLTNEPPDWSPSKAILIEESSQLAAKEKRGSSGREEGKGTKVVAGVNGSSSHTIQRSNSVRNMANAGMVDAGMASSVASDSSHKSFTVQVNRSRAGSSAHVNQLVQEKEIGSSADAPGSSPYSTSRVEAMNRGEMVADEDSNSGDSNGKVSGPNPQNNSVSSDMSVTKVERPSSYEEGLSLASAGSYEGLTKGSLARIAENQRVSPKAVAASGSSSEVVFVQSTSMPPTWDPVDPFSYPVANIPIKNWVPDNLIMEHFTEIQYIADGSNSNIFLARLNGEKVVIKMIREGIQYDPVAVHEFDVEHGILARVNHPNVIKLKGAGKQPRRFIVLEWLGGGTLSSILSQHQVKSGLAQKLFRRPSFTYQNLLLRARDICEALRFLHSHCHVGATIIHRDLKPDNIGFNSSGQLKLFDFGLCTCVKLRSNVNEAYEMTGNTGSLRYMAPEIALKKSYNEKADVYSFSVMLWQMTKDKVPFKGMSRDDFMTNVVIRGERPKLDKSWPRAFSNMLVKCWDPDHRMRPSFAELVIEIDELLASANWRYGGDKKAAASSPASSDSIDHGNKADDVSSSWRSKVSTDKDSDSMGSPRAKESERQSMWF